MRRIPEQREPEPSRPSVGTNRLTRPPVSRRLFLSPPVLGRFLPLHGSTGAPQQALCYEQQTCLVYGAPHHRLIALFYNGPVSRSVTSLICGYLKRVPGLLIGVRRDFGLPRIPYQNRRERFAQLLQPPR